MGFAADLLVHTECCSSIESTLSAANLVQVNRAISSAVERRLHTADVSGSIPLSPTTFQLRPVRM
jgi:hypothetical protein